MDNNVYKIRLRRAIRAGKDRAKTWQAVSVSLLEYAATEDGLVNPSDYAEPFASALTEIATLRLALHTACKNHGVNEKELLQACREVMLSPE
jgi:hypothetical protein